MYFYSAKVLRVVDGDTLYLQVDLGFNISISEKFRILDIDAPETFGVAKDSEEYVAGSKAKEWLASIIDGKEILVRTEKGKGKFGRWLAEIFLGEMNIGKEMIKLGLAKPYGASK